VACAFKAFETVGICGAYPQAPLRALPDYLYMKVAFAVGHELRLLLTVTRQTVRYLFITVSSTHID
jgi:hypothetical protein